jgi:molybdopterin molybdotransferase
MVLQPLHFAQLASAGVYSVEVCRRPTVAFFCTGSELRQSSNDLGRGEKVSSNSFLLQGLLTSSGCRSEDLGIIEDNANTLYNLFNKIKKQRFDLIISTGGMGPGKYDLVQKAFVQAGGRVIFSALDMRPGKSTLFGTLGSSLFLGLPGPPHAVHTLFNLLTEPTVWALQGVNAPWPQKAQAYLEHSVKVKRSDVLRLKGGVVTLDGGRCTVRSPQKMEVSNCFILLSAEQDHYPEGELIEIILRAGSGIKM